MAYSFLSGIFEANSGCSHHIKSGKLCIDKNFSEDSRSLFKVLRGSQKPLGNSNMKPTQVIIVTGIIALISIVFFFASFKRWSTSNYKYFQLEISGEKIISPSSNISVNQGDDVELDATATGGGTLFIADYNLSLELQSTQTGMIFNAVRVGNFPIQLKETLKDGKIKTTDIGILTVNPH